MSSQLKILLASMPGPRRGVEVEHMCTCAGIWKHLAPTINNYNKWLSSSPCTACSGQGLPKITASHSEHHLHFFLTCFSFSKAYRGELFLQGEGLCTRNCCELITPGKDLLPLFNWAIWPSGSFRASLNLMGDLLVTSAVAGSGPLTSSGISSVFTWTSWQDRDWNFTVCDIFRDCLDWIRLRKNTVLTKIIILQILI